MLADIDRANRCSLLFSERYTRLLLKEVPPLEKKKSDKKAALNQKCLESLDRRITKTRPELADFWGDALDTDSESESFKSIACPLTIHSDAAARLKPNEQVTVVASCAPSVATIYFSHQGRRTFEAVDRLRTYWCCWSCHHFMVPCNRSPIQSQVHSVGTDALHRASSLNNIFVQTYFFGRLLSLIVEPSSMVFSLKLSE